MFNKHRRLAAAFSLSVLLGWLVGCGPSGPEISSVVGKVTMDDKPLANATVVFVPLTGGRPAAAKTNESGEYELNFSAGRKGTIPGKNRVRITTLSDPYEDADGNKVPGSKETIPIQYNQQTELEFEVVEGQRNEANFELKSGGKIVSSPEET